MINKIDKKQFDYEKNFMGVGDLLSRRRKALKIDRFEYRMFNFLRHIKTPSGRICDVGCGGGVFLEKIKILFPKLECYGCDISEKAIEIGKILAGDNLNLQLIKSDGIPPYPDNFFDLCTSFNVLEHIEDIPFQIREIHRILKPGGKLHICVPCEGQPFTMTWFYQKTGLGKNFTYKNWGHIQPELTHEKMIFYLQLAGFKIDKVTFSMHSLIDFFNLFLYFLPKEILYFVLGSKAYQFTDAGTNEDQFKKEKKRGFLFLLRRFWIGMFKIISFFQLLDTIILAKIPFTASTTHITCQKE